MVVDQVLENQNIYEGGIQGNVGMVTVIAEEIVVHVADVAVFDASVDANGEQKNKIDNLSDGKDGQQDIKVLFFPCFRRSRQKDERGEKKPDVAFEGAPGDGHVLGVDESEDGNQEYAKQKEAVWDAIVVFEVLPFLAPVPLGNAK